MNYSLQNQLLSETTRYALQAPARATSDSIRRLAAQYSVATTDTQRGNLGEALALIFLGLAHGEVDFTTAQASPLNTNKWNNGFPFVDLMSRPLDASSSVGSALDTTYWSVKTGRSPTSFGSLFRLANFPHWTGRGMAPIGLRDLMTRTADNPRQARNLRTPDEIKISIGYVHVSMEGPNVLVRIFEPNEITFTKTDQTIWDALPERQRSIRGQNLITWCHANNYYAPESLRATTARQFWTRQPRGGNITIPVDARIQRQVAVEMIPPVPTRRSIAQRLERLGNRARPPRIRSRAINPRVLRRIASIADLPDNQFYREWGRESEFETVYRAYYERWNNQHGGRVRGLDRRTRSNYSRLSLTQERDAALSEETTPTPG
ncbi:MAG: hypothetical protein CBD74_02305 [Saprospirales bacterium TMED214]|nr:MAG: hypothetical protein CBD74_02305 [Saprospirales bacterium TMED214]